ncbi:MAG: ion transporter [Pseudobutyrivibrio sp.]|nr:ion transporter [Pseudobutyrivibrio sp.]
MKFTEEHKKRVFDIIEQSKENDRGSKAYDIMILVTVLSSFTPMMLKNSNRYTSYIEIATLVIFILDYALRVYTADYKMGVKSWKSYVSYIFTPMAIIDFISIIPGIGLFIPTKTSLNILRLLRLLRVLKITRYSSTMVLITNVLRRVRKELLAVLAFSILYIYVSALLIFQVEPDIFNTFFDALYWATISITTIGYGDISPVTSLGRMVTMMSAIVGVAIIALPSGIITAAYMDEIKRRKEKGKYVL